MNIDKIFHERNFMKETENYASLSVQKLIELAQERGIKGVRGKKKDSLVEIHKK